MEWFLSQTGEINGYSECYWNGNTTLTWAKFCLYLMENWDNEYYKNLVEEDIRECINIEDNFVEFEFEIEDKHYDLYFWGIKK